MAAKVQGPGDRAPFMPNNCAVAEFTADMVPVGRCFYHLTDGVCPRHGDVRDVQRRYVEIGALTKEPDHVPTGKPRRVTWQSR